MSPSRYLLQEHIERQDICNLYRSRLLRLEVAGTSTARAVCPLLRHFNGHLQQLIRRLLHHPQCTEPALHALPFLYEPLRCEYRTLADTVAVDEE